MEWRPKIIAFACNWGGYASADLAGMGRINYPSNVRIIRLMCSARVDPVFVLEAFRNGSDGVLILGCHPEYCHYINGNEQAETRAKFLKLIMKNAGVDPERLRMEWLSASEGARFAKVIKDFVNHLESLGPSPIGRKKADVDLLKCLEAAEAASGDFRLRALVSKERKVVQEGNVYGETKPREEFDEVMKEAVDAEYIRNRIYLMVDKKPMSAKDLASTLGVDPAKVLRHIVVMRRRGLVGLDRVEGTSPLYTTLKV